MKLKWVEAIRLRKEKWFPSYTSVICSRHFREDCYDRSYYRKRLLDTAIPTERLLLPNKEFYTKSLRDYRKPGTSKYGHGEMPTSETICDGKLIISNVYSFLEAEYKTLRSHFGNRCDLSPLTDILRRTAEATGVTKGTVSAIVKSEKIYKRREEALRKMIMIDQVRLAKPRIIEKIVEKPPPPPKINYKKKPRANIKRVTLRPTAIAPKPTPLPAPLVLLSSAGNESEGGKETFVIEYDDPGELNAATAILQEVQMSQLAQIKDEPVQLFLLAYDPTQTNNVATNQFVGFNYDTEVENIVVTPDIEELCLQHEPIYYTTPQDNLSYTCDVEIHAVQQPHPEPQRKYAPPILKKNEPPAPKPKYDTTIQLVPCKPNPQMEVKPQVVITPEVTDGTLDYRINNNVQEATKDTTPKVEITPVPANEDKNRLKVSLDNIIWEPEGVGAKYKPRVEFADYYRNFM